jgi:hypothetical protein
VQGIQAISNAYTVFNSEILGELGLECFKLLPKQIPPGVENATDCLVDFLLKFEVSGAQI